jgi:hypothetical protein
MRFFTAPCAGRCQIEISSKIAVARSQSADTPQSSGHSLPTRGWFKECMTSISSAGMSEGHGFVHVGVCENPMHASLGHACEPGKIWTCIVPSQAAEHQCVISSRPQASSFRDIQGRCSATAPLLLRCRDAAALPLLFCCYSAALLLLYCYTAALLLCCCSAALNVCVHWNMDFQVLGVSNGFKSPSSKRIQISKLQTEPNKARHGAAFRPFIR